MENNLQRQRLELFYQPITIASLGIPQDAFTFPELALWFLIRLAPIALVWTCCVLISRRIYCSRAFCTDVVDELAVFSGAATVEIGYSPDISGLGQSQKVTPLHLASGSWVTLYSFPFV